MSRFKKLIKKINQIVDEISIEEIERRIDLDEQEKVDLELCENNFKSVDFKEKEIKYNTNANVESNYNEYNEYLEDGEWTSLKAS